MNKWTRTTPITTIDAEAEPKAERLFSRTARKPSAALVVLFAKLKTQKGVFCEQNIT